MFDTAKTWIGRLVYAPEIKTTSTGKKTCRVRIACTTREKNDDGSYLTIFKDCESWESNAERMATFAKGDLLLVEGDVRAKKPYTDKYGVEHKNDEYINVSSVQAVAQGKNDRQSSTRRQQGQQPQQQYAQQQAYVPLMQGSPYQQQQNMPQQNMSQQGNIYQQQQNMPQQQYAPQQGNTYQQQQNMSQQPQLQYAPQQGYTYQQFEQQQVAPTSYSQPPQQSAPAPYSQPMGQNTEPAQEVPAQFNISRDDLPF